MHGLIDTVIVSTMSAAFPVVFGRDVHTSSTTSRCRRDLVINIISPQGAPHTVLQGEEKAVSAFQKGHYDKDPAVQLSSRTPWDSWEAIFGDSPSALAYTAIGCLPSRPSLNLQFGLLVKATKSFRPLPSASFDISSESGRIQAFHMLLRLLPHLRLYAELADKSKACQLNWSRPETQRGVYRVSLSLTMHESALFVNKKWKFTDDEGHELLLTTLQSLYGQLASIDPNGRHFQRLVVWNQAVPGQRTATFSPFAEKTWSRREHGLRALVHVMEAVLLLHKAFIVHRDLRWDNVVYHKTKDRFILIDFDDAVKLDDARTTPAIHDTQLSREQHAPACFDGPHGCEVDVWSLGFLMSELATVLDDVPVKDTLNRLAAQIQEKYKELGIEKVQQMYAEVSPLLA